MIDVQTAKCPNCNHSFDFSSYVGEEPLNSSVRVTKKLIQRTSWEELDSEISAGRAELILDVGDKLDITMKDGMNTSAIVAAINPYGNCVAFSFGNVLKTAKMNQRGTNRGGWAQSEVAGELDKSILLNLPDDLIAVIKDREITQFLDGKTYTKKSKLWLPSYTEVAGYDEFYSQIEKGDARFPLFKTRSGRARYTAWGEIFWWWLRSPHVSNTTHFWFVYNYGYVLNYYNASNAGGVCPCFII